MAVVQFLLKSELEAIDFSGLKSVKKEYFDLLEANVFPKAPENNNFFEMINYLKRKDENNPISIGPYRNITPFEAANRIASDLVIINGLLQLIKEKYIDPLNTVFTLRLGTTHIKDKGDFTIKTGAEESEGEAFNVAPSFFKSKLNKTLKKWKGKNLHYIFINEDAFEEFKSDKLNIKVIKVRNRNE